MSEPVILPAWEKRLSELAEGFDLSDSGDLQKLQLHLYKDTLRRSVADLRTNAKTMRGDGQASTSRVDVVWDILNAWLDYGSPARRKKQELDADQSLLIVQGADALEKRYETSREAELMETVALLLRSIANDRDADKIRYRAAQVSRTVLEV